jgi:PPM family protein phosphatase
MNTMTAPQYDVATALSQGARDVQEDALVTDFPLGPQAGFMVLADGMGGHTAGEIASTIVVTEMFAELKFKSQQLKNNETQVPQVLHHAALSANQCIRGYVSDHPESYGMGATLVAPMFIEDRLYWVSVGDSPLYLFRDGKLKQLNEDHSLAPEIDLMVRSGMMTEEQGRNHPDRNCLKSVIFGSEIAKVDCPREPFKVEQDDIFVASSDGLQTLTDAEIEAILDDNRTKPSHAIVSALLAAVEKIDDPDQDNISISVIKVTTRTPVEVFDSTRHVQVAKPRGVSMPTRVLQFVSGR